MMSKKRTYSRYALEAATLLGGQIKLGRKKRRWSELDLAGRAGISRSTLQKIEAGEMNCVMGSVLEVATLVGVKLFESPKPTLAKNIEHTRDRIALLPQRIRAKKEVVDDDF
jgi:transcriptional regulator with XRE-family HTH domain